MKMRVIAIGVLGLLGPAAAKAGEGGFRVTEQAGQAVEAGTTTLTLKSDDKAPVFRILSTSTAVGSSFYGGTASAYGENVERVCMAPCKVEVPNGTYDFRVGDNLLFAGRFTVEASGGQQVWAVDDGSTAMGIGGIALTTIGASGAAAGLTLLAFDDQDIADPLPLIAIGGAALAAGIWMWIEGTGDAERVD